jgi:phosphoribosylformylglycinamidine synthase
MLIVVRKGKEKEVQKIFEKWDLNCVQIGEVSSGTQLKFYMNAELVADVPADSLVLGGGAPVYNREYSVPAYFYESKRFSIDQVEEPEDLTKVASYLLGHHNIASRRWVSTQYDSMVGTVNMTQCSFRCGDSEHQRFRKSYCTHSRLQCEICVC